TGAGGRGAASQPVEQLDAELVLEGADVLGDRGLRQEQRLTRAREAAQLGDLDEDLEPTQVHRRRRPARAGHDADRGWVTSGTGAAAAAAAAAARAHRRRDRASVGPEPEDGELPRDAITLAGGTCDGGRRDGEIPLEVRAAFPAPVLVDGHPSLSSALHVALH